MKYLTFKARQFRAEVSDIVTNCPTGAPRTLLGRLGVLIELTPPTRRRLDIDNFCKSTVDALMHAGVFVDDEQIDELRVKRLHVEPPGCCDVVIQELE
jgi:crossover junction endodeoxyribonuclease RusA